MKARREEKTREERRGEKSIEEKRRREREEKMNIEFVRRWS